MISMAREKKNCERATSKRYKFLRGEKNGRRNVAYET